MAWGKNGTPLTLGSALDDLDITDLSGLKFNQFLTHIPASGNMSPDLTFNNNSNTVYASRKSSNGGAEITQTSKAFHEFNTNLILWSSSEFYMNYTCSISGEEKLSIVFLATGGTAGASNAPERVEFVGKFVPSPDADITRIDNNNVGSGSFDTSSNLSALGSDITPAAAIPFPTNVQVGSRAEITDTRKMYHYTSDNFSYDSKSFSVTSQDTIPQGMFFKPDGTKMYMVGRTNDTVYQYSLSTAWDISTSSYDSVSFSVATQDVNPESISFKSDGTKMYMVGSTSDKVYQYTLSTSWDLSTTSYDSVSFSVSSQELTPQGMFFKSDGTKMYIVGYTNDTVYQYSLSSAWDLSTASYDSVSFSVGSQDTVPSGLSFTSNGTKMYIVGRTNDIIYQYTLSTAWDVSTASYDSISFSVTSQESSPQDMFFKSDDTKIYIVGYTNDTVYQYSLGNAWSEEGT